MSLQKAAMVQACNRAVLACRVAERVFLEALFEGRGGAAGDYEARLRDLEAAENNLAGCQG